MYPQLNTSNPGSNDGVTAAAEAATAVVAIADTTEIVAISAAGAAAVIDAAAAEAATAATEDLAKSSRSLYLSQGPCRPARSFHLFSLNLVEGSAYVYCGIPIAQEHFESVSVPNLTLASFP
jgi:hypothetical protein